MSGTGTVGAAVRRASHGAALLLVALLAAGLSGCGGGDDPRYIPSVGVTELGDEVDALSLTVVADGAGVATLVGTLLNHGTHPDQLVGASATSAVDGRSTTSRSTRRASHPHRARDHILLRLVPPDTGPGRYRPTSRPPAWTSSPGTDDQLSDGAGRPDWLRPGPRHPRRGPRPRRHRPAPAARHHRKRRPSVLKEEGASSRSHAGPRVSNWGSHETARDH